MKTQINFKLFLFVMLGVLVSCKDPKQNNIKKGMESVEKPTPLAEHTHASKELLSKNYTLTNDEFRDKIYPLFSVKNDLEILEKITNILDRHKLSVCDVIQQLFVIDDASLANAKRLYPDPSQQELFSDLYTSTVKREYRKYAKSLNLSMDDIGFLNTAYAFHKPIKLYCGNF